MYRRICLVLILGSILSGCLFGSGHTFLTNIKIEIDRQKKSTNTVAVMFFFVKDLKKAEEIMQKSPEELNDEYNKNTSSSPPEGLQILGDKVDYYNIEDKDIVVAVSTFSFIGDKNAADYRDIKFEFTKDESFQKVLMCYFPDFPGNKPEDYRVYEITEDIYQVDISCNAKQINIKWE